MFNICTQCTIYEHCKRNPNEEEPAFINLQKQPVKSRFFVLQSKENHTFLQLKRWNPKSIDGWLEFSEF